MVFSELPGSTGSRSSGLIKALEGGSCADSMLTGAELVRRSTGDKGELAPTCHNCYHLKNLFILRFALCWYTEIKKDKNPVHKNVNVKEFKVNTLTEAFN